jgi:glycosyltransferase involved in cell wall biosynthesis
MRQLKVHFSIGDQLNWAVDEDLSLIKVASDGLVQEVDFLTSDVVFAAWWAPLLDMDSSALKDKTVICSMHGDPTRFLATPSHARIFDIVDIWLARSTSAAYRLNELGFKAVYVPYGYNKSSFSTLEKNDPLLEMTRSKLGEIGGKYLVGSFMRDSEGSNLNRPKLVKGPDMLLEIFRQCHKQNLPVLPVLAGPRRHWLRHQLMSASIEYVFIGEHTNEDDMSTNTLNRKELNAIYNLLDLTIISSRSEGGPLAVCEATAAGCKMIATRVGMVPDVLGEKSIFTTAQQAVKLISQDIKNRILDKELVDAQNRLHSNHSIDVIRNILRDLFSSIDNTSIENKPIRQNALLIFKKINAKLNRFIQFGEHKPANCSLFILSEDSPIWEKNTMLQHFRETHKFSPSDQSSADIVSFGYIALLF